MNQNPKSLAYDDLKARILAMKIAPGADLDETALSTRYGISRTPLREVLQRLAGAGLVVLATHRGAKAAAMDLPTLRTFFQTAPMIYAAIAQQAAAQRSLAQLDQLKAVQRDFAAATDVSDIALQNHRFHELIGQMSANPYLIASLDRLLIEHTRLSQTFYRADTPQDADRIATAAQQHDAMIAAFEAADADAAVSLTLAHWDLSRDQLERFVRPDPLPLTFDHLKDPAHAV